MFDVGASVPGPSLHNVSFPPRRSQATVGLVTNDQVLGYPHPRVGSEFVPSVQLRAKLSLSALSPATATTDVAFTLVVGAKVKVGGDDQIYLFMHSERASNGR